MNQHHTYCPQCGHTRLRVDVRATALIHFDPAAEGGFSTEALEPRGAYDARSATTCPACGFTEDMASFCHPGPFIARARAWRGDLHHLAWRAEYNLAAEAEGWVLLNGRSIQRDSGHGLWADDDAALAHVRRLAEAGSILHRAALALHQPKGSAEAWAAAQRAELAGRQRGG